MILASNNQKKVEQFKKLLGKYEIKSLKDISLDIDVEEKGESFEDIALLKAKEVHKRTKLSALADDSGLCIDVFNGWPGVTTHRFLGENATSFDRNKYILEKMKLVPREKRTASVVCALAFIDKKGKSYVAIGERKVYISTSQKGENSFGFDAITEIDENGRTAAELSNEEKNRISARSIACKNLLEILDKINPNDI